MKLIFPILITFFSVISLDAQYFEWNENCTNIYEKIFEFKFKLAKNLIAEEPTDNLTSKLFENYIDFFVMVINEDETELSNFVNRKDARLKAVLKGNESPYRRYIQAELNMQSGFVKLSQEDFMSAFWDIRRAYKLYKENEKRYPNFGPNKKGIGLLQMLIGTIPDKYQWGVKIVGLSGSLEEGAKEMEDFIYNHKSHPIQEEAKMLYAFVKYFVEDDKETARRLIYKEIDPQKGVWQNMTVANLANAMGENDFAIETLEQCKRNKETYPFPTIDLMLGICKLNRLDANADIPLNKFLRISKASAFKKEAYQKLAWHALINGDESSYKSHINKILKAGNNDRDEDKQASQEAQYTFIPNINLLKARLLFDGGYYTKALELINNVNPMLLLESKEQIEFNYRLGRIYQKLNEYDDAIKVFTNLLVTEPKNTKFYFAPKVLLELGGIYEGRGEYQKARTLYNSVKEYTNHPYVDSFAQQSKNALKRIKGKYN